MFRVPTREHRDGFLSRSRRTRIEGFKEGFLLGSLTSPAFRPIAMAFRSFWRSKSSSIFAGLLRSPAYNQRIIPAHHSVSPLRSLLLRVLRSDDHCQQGVPVSVRHYHDGRPRGPLWRGKKMIGKEALFVILGLKRFKDDEENLEKFIRTHVRRLLKMDMVAVLIELERQQDVLLALRMFKIIQKEDWYKPDVYLYKDLIISLAKCKKMDDVMQVWEMMRKDGLFPDSQTYAEVIRGFLKYGSPADAMNIYEDMKKSPEPPQELPFRILLKGLLPHPLLRNRVKQDFEEMFPDRHVYDPPEEIFGMR